jgi:hypothetical protein
VELISPRLVVALCLALSLHAAPAQQAVPSIEQSRLFQRNPGTTNTNVTADGAALPSSEPLPEDDSFGDQEIFKTEPRVRTFALSGDASLFYTDNVSLTRRVRHAEAFFVGRAAATWTPRISPTVEAQIAASVSTFRYTESSELDFTNLSLGAGLSWAPQNLRGVALFARYDFIELLNRDSDEILQGHEFTVGAQKVFALGRSHAFTVGAFGMTGFANPDNAERDQGGVFFGYRLMLTRALEADLQYRLAGQFYDGADHNDLNQVLSLNLRYRVAQWAEVNAFFSFGNNRSDRSVFDYNVLNTGAGVGVSARF